jgi:hypothetical protein
MVCAQILLSLAALQFHHRTHATATLLLGQSGLLQRSNALQLELHGLLVNALTLFCMHNMTQSQLALNLPPTVLNVQVGSARCSALRLRGASTRAL